MVFYLLIPLIVEIKGYNPTFIISIHQLHEWKDPVRLLNTWGVINGKIQFAIYHWLRSFDLRGNGRI